jgi:hypothetical protein
LFLARLSCGKDSGQTGKKQDLTPVTARSGN